MTFEEKAVKFDEAIKKNIGVKINRNSIGLLSEKTLHTIVKDFYARDEESKEVKVGDFCCGYMF